MYRLLFLTLALGGLLMAVIAPAQANRTPLPSMNSTAASAMIHEHAAVSGGVPLTDAEMQRLTAGQGCFGVGSTNCCKEGKLLLAGANMLNSYFPNIYFSVAILIGTVHQIYYC